MLSSGLRTALLCTTFALMAAGCDQHKEAKAPAAPAAAAATATVETKASAPLAAPATTAPAAVAPAVATVAPAAATAPAPLQPDERTFSNGERVGHVTKFSFKSSPLRLDGADLEACKNWEGELSMDNTVANNSVGADGKPSASNAFSFSVGKGRNDIVKKVQGALRQGYKVSLQYNQVVRHDECKSRTDYYVVGVTNLDAPKVKPHHKAVVQQPRTIN